MRQGLCSVVAIMLAACAAGLACASADEAEEQSAPGSADEAGGGAIDVGGAAAPSPGAAGGAPALDGVSGDEAAGEGRAAPVGLDGTSGASESAPAGAGDNGTGESGTGESGAPAPPVYGYGATLEDTGLDCVVGALPDPAALPELDTLPDPFLKLDGTRLARQSEWRCRRQEIRRQAERYIYGDKPPRPQTVTGTVTADTVSVDVTHEGRSVRFSAEVVLPAGEGPFPAIINLGARGSFGGITLGESFILEQGVAIIFYNHYDLGQEGTPEASRGLPNPGLFYDLFGGDHSAGLLMAWAWGASRLIDVLQQSGADVIDPTRLGVTGCSRNGKGAFTVGAFDERIALTIAQETSTGGLPSYRIVDVTNGAERTNWNYFGLNWLSDNFEPFVERATRLPIDSHEIVAMVAPRGLLVLDNPHVAQFAAGPAHTAVLAGAEVFRALGAGDNVSYVSDIENPDHCAVGKPEYAEPLIQSIGKFLKRDREASGVMAASPSASGDPSRWVTWQTPALENDLAN